MMRFNIPQRFILGCSFLWGITSCDSSSAYQGNEVAATKKMHQKVQKIQAKLQQHSDSMLYKEASRLADSMRMAKAK